MNPVKLTIEVYFTDESAAHALLNELDTLESANSSLVVNFDFAMESITDEEINRIRDEVEANKKLDQGA